MENGIVIVELTEEEVEMILKKREKETKHAEATRLLEEIKTNLKAIEALGYKVRGTEIGGGYVTKMKPQVCGGSLQLTTW